LLKYLSEIHPSAFGGVAILVVLLPIMKVALSHTSSKHTIKLKSLELFLSIYENKDQLDTERKFIVEQLIYSIYKIRIDYSTIESLLNSKSPMRSFELYKRARYYIVVTDNDKPLRRAKRYKSFKLFNITWFYMVTLKEFFIYLVAMSVSMLSLLVTGAIWGNLPSDLNGIVLYVLFMASFVVSIVSGYVGIHYLKREGGIREVKELLKLQLTKRVKRN